MIEKIYFDMDDTIADFSLGLIEICGIDPVDQENTTKEQDDAMWEKIKESKIFYLQLKELDAGMAILKELKEKYGSKVAILSATPKTSRGINNAEEDKRKWVIEHIGEDIEVYITQGSANKQSYAKEGCLLIDDFQRNIDQWEANGGIGILFERSNPQKAYKSQPPVELVVCNAL